MEINGVLEGLRRRVAEVQADSARSEQFLASLAQPPEREWVGSLGAVGPAGSGARPDGGSSGRAPQAGATGRAQATAGSGGTDRAGRARARRSVQASSRMPRRGVWAHLSARMPVAVDPREAFWLDRDAPDPDGLVPDPILPDPILPDPIVPARDQESLDDLEPLDDEAGTHLTDEPVGVMLDAMVGMALSRHGEAELAAAAEHVAGLRLGADAPLVQVLAELEARGVEPPG